LNLLLFYLLSAIIVISAILVVTIRSVFHSALFLVLAFFTVAGIYLMLHAEFLAAVQVLIYVGAVTILMLFAIMLTYQIQSKSIRQVNEQAAPAALISAVFLALAVFAMTRTFGGVDKPVHNPGGWAASIAASDLPSQNRQWAWTANIEDKDGKNYLAGGNLLVVQQKQARYNRSGAIPELASPAGYLLSSRSDFSNKTHMFSTDETINLCIWSDSLDYSAITDATWKLTNVADTSRHVTLRLVNSNPEQIGRLLMSQFALPFEAVSVLLLAALIGAIVISRKDV